MLRKSCYRIPLIISIFFGVKVNAQIWGTSFRNVINVGTTSPEAASLGKFGNVPVSYYTGVPGINIPVHEIRVGKISLPVSLTYHAGGVRVDETSSSVGTGWALNGIGVISRNMVGLPDETGGTGYYVGSPAAQTVINSPSQYAEYIYGIKSGTHDAEPDLFQYNVNGLSGKFIFRNDGSIMEIPVTNNKIIFANGNFTIKDPNGLTYIFEEKRQTYSSDASALAYISSWCLTKMVDENSVDEIYFNYEQTPYSYASYQKLTNFTHVFGYELEAVQVGNCTNNAPWYEARAIQDIGPHQLSQTITHFEYYPKEIIWRGGKISFVNINDRADVTGTGLRLDRIEVYSYQNGVYNLVKKTKLNQSYFYSDPGGTITEKNYRLKLDFVENLDVNTNTPAQVYRMEYNNTPIAPRESCAQDRWGFNNGHYENSDLMPKQTRLYNGAYYTFGNANRETDESKILAGTLTSIEYPTKGKTVFDFKPHKFHTSIPAWELKTLSSSVCCATQSYAQQTFTVNNNSNNYRYKVFISKFNYPDVTDRPRVKLTDQTTGQLVMQESTFPTTATDQDYTTGTIALNLVHGHTYLLEVNIYTTNPNVSASCDINWEETITGASDIRTGGGLRVESITNYDVSGKFISKEIYQYGYDGTGTIITPQYYQDLNYETVVHRIAYDVCQGIAMTIEPDVIPFPVPGYTTIYHANSVLPTSQYSGSPVVYKEVTKMEVDASDNAKGKTVYGFGVFEDGASTPFEPITGIQKVYFPKPGMYLISDNWKNGHLTYEEIHKSTGTGDPIIKKIENTYSNGLSAYHNVLKVKPVYLHVEHGELFNVSDYILTAVPFNTGARLLTSTKETIKDHNGNSLFTTKTFTYGNMPLLPSKIETTSSSGQTLADNFKYPIDLAVSGNVYEKMVSRNIVSPVVQTQKLRDNVQLSLLNISYKDWFNDSKLLLPQSAEEQIRSNTIETKINFNKFDAYGSILEQQKTNDVKEVYLWGYNSQYPVAKIINTTYDIAKTYVTQSILDAPTDDAALRSHLNNLRNIPKALVTTYTYKPLIGITSETDPRGKTIYYEYDGVGRLLLIRDQDRNILKKFCYNYAGQPENCSIFYNVEKTQSFTKTGCASCTTPSSVVYTVPANKYFSTSQEEANALAQSEIDQNGQNYANENGTCTAVSPAAINSYNSSSANVSVSFFNTSTFVTYDYTAPIGSNSQAPIIPCGNYNISMSPGISGTYTYYINGYSTQTSGTANFSNIPIGGTITMTIGN